MKNKIFTLLLFFFLNHSLSASEKIKPIIEGNINAKVKIIVYESLTCSHCANFHKNVYPKLKVEFLDKGLVSIEFKNFQFSFLQICSKKLKIILDQDHLKYFKNI